MELDVIDRYLQQLDFLKERERYEHKIQQLEDQLKNIRNDEPIRILKKIIENRYHPERLPSEWKTSGLINSVNEAISLRAKVQARAILDREYNYDSQE